MATKLVWSDRSWYREPKATISSRTLLSRDLRYSRCKSCIRRRAQLRPSNARSGAALLTAAVALNSTFRPFSVPVTCARNGAEPRDASSESLPTRRSVSPRGSRSGHEPWRCSSLSPSMSTLTFSRIGAEMSEA